MLEEVGAGAEVAWNYTESESDPSYPDRNTHFPFPRWWDNLIKD